jgi:hypothetical protein
VLIIKNKNKNKKSDQQGALEARFKEVKRLRRRFDDSVTIQFPTIHLTQNFVAESSSESPPEST